jgi:3-oxoisoapionate decarboxylase
MKLGISSYTYTWAIGVPGHLPARVMSTHDLVQAAAALGVHVVQIADNLPLHHLVDADCHALVTEARDLQVAIEVGTRGISPDHLARYIDLATLFQSSILRVVIDTSTHHPTEDEVIDLLRAQVTQLTERHITLAIENHDRFSAKTFARIIERIGSPSVGICLDTVNSFGALEGPEVVVDTLADYVVNLHIKDFSIQRHSHMMGFTIEGQPAGQGRLDIPWLLACLAQKGRDPNAILELWTPPESDVETTIAKERSWAEQSVYTLRQWIKA